MVVLHVLAPMPTAGGMERVVTALARGQADAGHDVHVALVGESPSAEDIGLTETPGLTIHIVQIPARQYARERAAIRALCDALHPEVVHNHGYRPDVVAGSVGSRSAAVVSTVHGFTRGDVRNRLYEWLQRRALRRRDAVAAVSRPLHAELVRSGVPEDRVSVVPNACAPAELLARDVARQHLGVASDRFLVGWVGRLSREKGADVLVSAMATLPEQVHAVVIGAGPEERWLRSQAGACAVSGRIIWAGAVPNAARFMSAFDCLALSSRTEGSPIVILEAMAGGVPIVATNVGGVSDLVGDGGAALVPPEDPRALALAIRDAYQNPGAAAQRARIARGRFDDHYRVGPWVLAYERFYRKAMERAA